MAVSLVVVVVVPVDIHLTPTFVPCTYKPNLLYEIHKKVENETRWMS